MTGDEPQARIIITNAVDRAARAEVQLKPLLTRVECDINSMVTIVREQMRMTKAQARRTVMELLAP